MVRVAEADLNAAGAVRSVASATLGPMKIAMASDHAGFELKEAVKRWLVAEGHQVEDVGTYSDESTDYPPFAERAARLVADDQAARGVLVCGSGNGVAIAANKVRGIRAVNAHDAREAEMSRRHNDANVVTLSGQRIDTEQAKGIVTTFLDTEFDGGRHQRRVLEIREIEGR